MSREPQSAGHWAWREWAPAFNKAEKPPEPTQPTPGKGKNIRVPPRKPRPTLGHDVQREAVLTKFTTTTEALTADERALLREMREVDPTAASRSLAAIRRAKKEKNP